jgi:nitrous oxidase accessory protein NosD
MDSRFVDAGPGGASATTPLTVNNSQFVGSSISSGSQSNTYIYNSQFTDGNITATYLRASGNVINSCPDGAVAGFDNSRYGGAAQLSGNTIRGCAVGIKLSAWEWDSAFEGNQLSGNTTAIQYHGTLPRALKITGNVLAKNAGDGLLGTGSAP